MFCAELPIFLREHKNGMYRTDVYFICKTLAEAPIFLAIPLIFTAVVYPMIGLYPDVKHFFIATAVVALVANVSTSFGNRELTEYSHIVLFNNCLKSYFFYRLFDILYQQQRIYSPLRRSSSHNTVFAFWRFLPKYSVSILNYLEQ